MHCEGAEQSDRRKARRADSVRALCRGVPITQRVGGYVFWTKRRLQPASTRFVAIVLLDDAEDPNLYLVPSTEWRNASPPQGP